MQPLAPSSFPPRRTRQSNEVAALRALHRFGRMSRAELARKLHLNRSSSGHIIAGLTTDGLVREVVERGVERPLNGRVGRPGILLQLVPEAIFFLGVEIGVEHISVVEIDLEAKIVSTSVEPSGRPSDIEATVERAVTQAFQTIPKDRWHRCEGVGVSAPAQMNKSGYIREAPLLGWRNLYPAEMVRHVLPVAVPVLAENDANAFAIGATYGREDAIAGTTLFVVIETGVGGGIIVDGTLLHGAHGLAGEIGHMRGAAGEAGRTLEQNIGLEAILTEYRAVVPDRSITFEAFVSDVRDRDPRAVKIAERWAKELAFGIAQVCRVIDPDRVMLGGSVAALYPLVAARVAFHMAQVQGRDVLVPPITVNEYAVYGSAFGAACMLHRRYLSLEGQRYANDGLEAEAARTG